MRITPYGIREVLIATILAWTLCALFALAALGLTPWLWVPANAALLVWIWVIWFFRDPDRTIPDGEELFVSPADGRVADITCIGPDSELGRNGVRIGIFMNVFDVHVNRIPCDGQIRDLLHRPGRFLDARNPDASEKNESATIHLIHTRNGREYPVVVRQIAGLVARRIVTSLEIDQTVTRGQRFGMIKFGSRLELLIPRELLGEVCVKAGKHVKGGQTVLVVAREEQTDE